MFVFYVLAALFRLLTLFRDDEQPQGSSALLLDLDNGTTLLPKHYSLDEIDGLPEEDKKKRDLRALSVCKCFCRYQQLRNSPDPGHTHVYCPWPFERSLY